MNAVLKRLVIALFIVLFMLGSAYAWWDEDWSYKRKITYTANVDLNAGFALDLNVDDFNLSQCIVDGKCKPDLSDVRMVDGTDTTEIDSVIEVWGAHDDNRLFFELDADMSATDTRNFYAYYGNASASAKTYDVDLNAPGWDYNYSGTGEAILVYHLEGGVKDSTKHSNDGTNHGVVWMNDKNCLFQQCGDFEKVDDDWIDTGLKVSDLNGDRTFYACFMQTGNTGGTDTLFGVYDAGESFFVYVDPREAYGLLVQMQTGGVEHWNVRITDPEFLKKYTRQCVAVSIGAAGLQVYIDGNKAYHNAAYTQTLSGWAGEDLTMGIGARHNPTGTQEDEEWQGQIDEFMIFDYQKTSFYKNYDKSINLADAVSVGLDIGVTSDFEYDVIDSVDNNLTHLMVEFNDLSSYGYISTISGKGYRWDFNGLTYSFDQNISRLLKIGEDYNVCLDANAVLDGSNYNDINCQVIQSGNYGVLGLRFYDENTGAGVQPSTLTVNGTSQDANVETNGQLTLSMGDFTQPFTIIASSSSYEEREWFFDNLNIISDYNYSLAMLEDANGASIDFRFYDTDETTVLANAMIEVRIEDINYASVKQTNASGEVSFFLNPDDENYFFHITKADDSTMNYYQATVTVKQPKDEKTLEILDTEVFDVIIGGVSSRTYANNALDMTFKVLTNTENYHIVKVDYNSIDYRPRTYSFLLKGDINTHTIQPYLPATADSADIYLYVVNSIDQKPVEGVRVVSKRVAGVLAGEEIESKYTDSSGAAVFAMLVGEEYRLYFYDEDDELIISFKIVPTSTTYTVRIDIATAQYTIFDEERIQVTFFPSEGFIEVDIAEQLIFDVNVFSLGNSILDINVSVIQKGVVIANQHGASSDGNYFVFGLDISLFDANHFFTVDVNITKANGVIEHYSKVYSIKFITSYNLLDDLRKAKAEIGGDLPANFVAMFITLFVVAGLGIQVTRKMEGLFAIAAIVMFFFVYIGWVNVVLYSIALLGGIASFIVARRIG